MPLEPRTNLQSIDKRTLELLCAIIEREFTFPRSRSQEGNTVPPPCPRCNGKNAVRRGRDSTGKQRFQCRDCDRSYTATTGNAFSSTNIPKETWLEYARCHLADLPIRASAERCNVSVKTALYMKKRVNRVISDYSRQVRKSLEKLRQAEQTSNGQAFSAIPDRHAR